MGEQILCISLGLRKTIIYCRGLCSLHFLNKKDADNMHIRLDVNFRKSFAGFNCLIYVTENYRELVDKLI